jgi:1-acyl-sn-glycerol-3-phosphate acyltransferase
MRDRVFPIAAVDYFFRTRLVSAFSSGIINALPMWRDNAGSGFGGARAIAHLRRRLIARRSVYIVFPEGTRSRTGRIGRFKPGVGMLVAQTSVPVVPCRIVGSGRALPAGAIVPRIGHALQLHIGRPCGFTDDSNDRAGWERIAAEIESTVRALQK